MFFSPDTSRHQRENFCQKKFSQKKLHSEGKPKDDTQIFSNTDKYVKTRMKRMGEPLIQFDFL